MVDDLLLNLNRRFDHTALHQEIDEAAIRKLCDEARACRFCTVAINPVWTRLVSGLLQESEVKVLSVSGFPLGAATTDIKVAEAIQGVSDGAHEIDMVANIGWLVSEEFSKAEKEIRNVREALPYNVILKVIIEAGKLSSQQQIEATRAVINGGAQFVKTCTGFFGGATVEQVKQLFQAANGNIEVKASGGIRTLDDCQKLLQAGASRLGSSASVTIMREFTARSNAR
ncbi:MAG: deoxyribose-phosphate aldolase [Candidatus Zixiibacteriota bacterium]|nr:MAG: deoxyribose-phosphate aldolase [candidate division Zixibacteria bacterium]